MNKMVVKGRERLIRGRLEKFTDLPIEKFVNVKIDEKGLDSENFVIRTGQSQ